MDIVFSNKRQQAVSTTRKKLSIDNILVIFWNGSHAIWQMLKAPPLKSLVLHLLVLNSKTEVCTIGVYFLFNILYVPKRAKLVFFKGPTITFFIESGTLFQAFLALFTHFYLNFLQFNQGVASSNSNYTLNPVTCICDRTSPTKTFRDIHS